MLQAYMSTLSAVVDWNGHAVTYTWVKADDLLVFVPITQCYGICFDVHGNILVSRKPGKEWQLPGGKPEAGETLEQALAREFLEEVNVKVKKVRPLGVQRVEFSGNPNKQEGELYYQARFICEVSEILPSMSDPDTGLIWERRFVPSGQITEWIKWGDLGVAMFADAIKLAAIPSATRSRGKGR
jgi:8-oxo-dGTP pyrophosphatase MutT (NUDIX family)